MASFGPAGIIPPNVPSQANQPNQSTTGHFAKGRKWMKRLCWIEFILGIFVLTLGSSCTGINAGHERTVCTFGTGIWVGLFSVCYAAIGLIAIQASPYQRRLLIIYFSLCVAGALAAIVLLGISCMWIERASKFYQSDNENYEATSVSLNVCLLVAAICQTICTFLSAVLLSHYYWGWCCRSNDFASPIAYVRAEETHEQHTNAVAAERGTRFLV